ncbi:MAG TPA: hypothetical protein VM347_26625 [Nonomuraea sp.]|nr:hypothetical protein [Nonomuraea sp.]
MATRNITELSSVEFTGSLAEAFHLYGKELTTIADRWVTELDIAAVDAEAAMSTMKGHWLLFGLDTRHRARQVAKRLKRARDLAAAMAEKGESLHRIYCRNFRVSEGGQG